MFFAFPREKSRFMIFVRESPNFYSQGYLIVIHGVCGKLNQACILGLEAGFQPANGRGSVRGISQGFK
jgi:hypothetical protein